MNVSASKTQADYRPKALLVFALILAVFACLMRYVLPVDENIRIWGFHTLLKVSLVTFTTALAWPQLKLLRKSSYGRIVLVGLAIAGLFFLIRPRAMTTILPIIVVAMLLLIALTFARNFFDTPREQK